MADEEGRPVTYYHGTSRVFDRFDKKHGGAVWDDEASRAGHFFTADKHEAHHFAAVAAGKLGGEPRVIAAHIALHKPAHIDDDVLSRHTEAWLRSLSHEEREEQEMTRAYDAQDGGVSKGLELAIVDAMRRGHDGAIVKLDGGTHWAVPFSEQAIKRIL